MAFVYLLSTPGAILFRFSRGRTEKNSVAASGWKLEAQLPAARSVVNVRRRPKHQKISICTTAARRVGLDDLKITFISA